MLSNNIQQIANDSFFALLIAKSRAGKFRSQTYVGVLLRLLRTFGFWDGV